MENLRLKPTKGLVKGALKALGKGMEGLDNTYQEAMTRIEAQSRDCRDLALRALAWIVYAERPLTTRELQEALAVQLGTPELDKDFIPPANRMQSICSGLVTIDRESNIIRLVHYTTQEFFLRTKRFPEANADIAKTCATYLSFNVFESGFCQSDAELAERLELNPLLRYATQSWGYHARVAGISGQVFLDFLKSKAKSQAACQAADAFRPAGRLYATPWTTESLTGLHLAAGEGVSEIVAVLLREWQNIDVKDQDGETPLWWAVEERQDAVVRLLLESGADVYVKNNHGNTVLWLATMLGYEPVIRLLFY